MTDAKEKMKLVSFAAGEIIFQEGDAADCAFVIKTGTVAIFRLCEGQRIVINHMEAGQILGEMAVISNEPRSASAAAETDCDLVMLDRKVLWSGFKKSLPIVQKIFEQLITRFKEKDSQLLRQPPWNAPRSIGHFLLFMTKYEKKMDCDALSRALHDILQIPQAAIDAVLEGYRQSGFLSITPEDEVRWVHVTDPDGFLHHLQSQS